VAQRFQRVRENQELGITVDQNSDFVSREAA
jgi:hypothetical protein